MAIGSWGCRELRYGGLVALLFVSLGARGAAEDQIQLKSGSIVHGQITGLSGGQLTVKGHTPSGSPMQSSVYVTDIQSITMAPPAAMAELKEDASPATVIATLTPLVQEYAGLHIDWVVDAMGQLADAYESANQSDRAAAIYAQINQLYPGSPYQNAAAAGTAQLDLQQGKVDEALALLQPLVDKANQDLAPAPAEGRFYARTFLVYGQALQAQKQYAKALEAYLTVKTMFYQNPALVAQAAQLAASLRQQNPGVSVD
jgi:tetratricopeptide (TPR) repeat protein